MRIHRLILEHFRAIDAETVTFDDGITIVEGPNEAGKSTIAEAISVLFDHLDSSRRQEVRAVHQIGSDTGPYVELDFTVGDYRISYAKRFLRKPETTLRVTAPVPEQHTGREAHERMGTILKETVDDALWTAMRVTQGASLSQPDLADVGALRAALDDNDESGFDDDGDLMGRVAAEYSRFFTPRTGQPTGELSAAVDAHTAAHREHSELQEELAAVENRVERFARIESELSRLGEEEAEHAQRLEELREKERSLEQLRKEHGAAAAVVDTASSRLAGAEHAVDQRSALVAEVEERRRGTEELGRDVDRLREEATEARAQADDAREAARRASEEARALGDAHRRATDVGQATRLAYDTEVIEERVERAARAHERIVAADAIRNSTIVDEDALERLVSLDAEVRRAQEVRRVSAASVGVEALGDRDVMVDGVATTDGGERPVLGPTVVEVPDVVRVTVRPGRAVEDLDADVRRAEETWSNALADADVVDLAAARAAVARRRDADAEREVALSRLRDALGDEADYDALAARATKLREQYERLRDRIGDEEAVPASIQEADEHTQSARTAYDRAAETAESAQRAADERDETATRARESKLLAEQRHDSEYAEVRRLDARLDEERTTASDADLDEALANERVHVDEATTTRERAAAALAAGEPDELAAMLDNAAGATDRISRARRELEDEQQQINGQLDDYASRGLHDKHEAATAELERAEGELKRVEARADAARLLHDTLQRHRDTARQRYVEPYKKAIESLGRIVFGPDLSVEIADDLSIVSRTVNGRTVGFGSLSGGSREQLAILGRLAVAALVDERDGAPLILDDAFGYADPERLDRLAAVLNQSGRDAQIIILTCHPERFRAIGSAEVVRIDGR